MTTTDELMRQIIELTRLQPGDRSHLIRVEALRTAIEEVVMNADRYRCIRDPEFHANNAELVATNYETGEQLDEAIDAAIRNTAIRSGG